MKHQFLCMSVILAAMAAFPEDNAGEDKYPDNLTLPLVNLPGGLKKSKWER